MHRRSEVAQFGNASSKIFPIEARLRQFSTQFFPQKFRYCLYAFFSDSLTFPEATVKRQVRDWESRGAKLIAFILWERMCN